MRVLILSSSTGAGHDSCAYAIKEAFDNHGEPCEVYEVLRFKSKFTTAVLTKGHTTIYRHFPKLFEIGYSFLDNHSSAYKKGSLTEKFFASGAKKLIKYVVENDYDTVICTHPFATIMLAAAISKHGLKVKSAFVATDYTCAPTVDSKNLDLYFIPDGKISKEFTEYGVDESKLVPTGIPVRQMFYQSTPKNEAKKAIGVKDESTHLLVMCGSMGCGPIKKIIKHISPKIPKNAEITIICGTNKKLKVSLEKKHKANPQIHIKGFVKNMSELLDSADLYLTKPGGLSVSEAKQKNLPMVFIDAVAGCEEYNRRFFVDLGAAISGESVKDLEDKCLTLLKDKKELEKMTKSFSAIDKINVSEAIREFLIKQ